MNERKFELWLDESGTFEKDDDISRNSSIVGGLLVEGNLSEEKALFILDKEYFHSSEFHGKEFGKGAIRILDDIVNGLKGKIVIFENKERLKIIDGDTTYLNIISEGVIQLLQELTATFGRFELDIHISVRLNMDKQYLDPGQIIEQDEYINRIKEKIILETARRTLSKDKYWKWNISLGSARKDQRLMLADVICNSFLTKNSNKFSDGQKEKLNILFGNIYYFTVFYKSSSVYIKKLITDGLIGEAIFETYLCEDNTNKIDLINLIISRLSMLSEEGIRYHLQYIKVRIGALIKIDKDLIKSKKLLINIQEDLMPLLKKENINPGFFSLDIYLYLLTVYTHEGNIKLAERQINLCENFMYIVTNRWESIEYYYMFKIRLAVHYINTFDFQLAIESMDEIINSLEEAMSLFSMVKGIDKIYNDIKSDLIGKALGTRLQARCYLIRSSPYELQEALKDSDRAILQFKDSSDLIRQYQYRSQIECEKGEYELALKYLCKSVGVEYGNEETLIKLLNKIIGTQEVSRIYSIMHYIRIMAEASFRRDKNLSNTMFEAFNKLDIINENFLLNYKDDHPYELIFWKLGTFFSKNNSLTAANKYYDKAIEICNKGSDCLTLRAIGLGIMAEKASVIGCIPKSDSKIFKLAIKDLKNSYENFMMYEGLPCSMKEYFMHWDDKIKKIYLAKEQNTKMDILWQLSRDITY